MCYPFITRLANAATSRKYAHWPLPAVSTSEFADAGQISSWANDSVTNMANAGIINGRTNGMFDPQGKATRAEIAAMLERLIENLNISE